VTTSSFLKFSGNIRIGELLVQAGMLTQTQLQDATKHAGTKRLQIGQILVMYGYLTARDLQSALAAQSMIRDRTLDLNQALRSLKIAYKTGSRFEDVIGSQSSAPNMKLPTGKLGELLLDSGIINSDQFLTAMDQSLVTGLPLGRTLVLEQVISDDLLTAALDTQVRLRDQMLSRDEAIAILKSAAGITTDDDKAPPKRTLPHRDGLRIGELLVLAGVLTPADVLDCLERALISQKLIGEAFIEQGKLKPDILEAGLSLQQMIHENLITPSDAAKGLNRIFSGQTTLEEIVEELNASQAAVAKQQVEYERLLMLARVISPDDVSSAIKIGLKNSGFLARLLVMTGFMDDLAMQASLRCFEMLSEGVLNQDDAVVSLDYCLHYKRHSPVSFEEALKELGWQPTPTTAPDAEEQQPDTRGDTESKVQAQAQPEPLVDQSNTPEATEPEAAESVSPPVMAPAAKKSDGKFTDTIAPEDVRSRELASLMSKEKNVDGILEKTAGGALGNVVTDSYTRLAESYIENGNYSEAQVVYERILVLRLQELGTTHPQLVQDLRNLAAVLCTQEKYEQAEPFMRRAVQILEQMDNDSLSLADTSMFLANIYLRQEKFQECEPLLSHALDIREKHLGPDHMEVADTMFDLARVFRKTGRVDDSEQMYTKAKDILAKHHEQETYI